MILLVSAAAIFNDKKEVLMAERPAGKSMAGLWEFPGGKVEPDENPEAALVREIKEELNIHIDTRHLKQLTFVSHAYDSFHLLMLLYGIEKWQGDIHPMENQKVKWIAIDNLQTLAVPPADIPLIRFLQKIASN